MKRNSTTKVIRLNGKLWLGVLAGVMLMAVNSETKAQAKPTIGFEAYSKEQQPGTREKFGSPIHHVPSTGDTIAFYGKGAYHLFILKDGGWQHMVSKDLLNWKELPMALLKGKPTDADGEWCFTGDIIEHDGTYHIFYPGVNRKHPKGAMQIMHATSKDLVNFTKHPEETWGPDGIHYKTKAMMPERANSPEQPTFKDPRVIWNPKTKEWWMFMSASPIGYNWTGLATSKSLKGPWKQQPAIKGLAAGDCTDVFKIGPWWYRVSYYSYWRAKDLAGPWSKNDSGKGYDFDTPYFFVPKRCWDGKRHVIMGGVRNYFGKVDHSNPLAPHCVAIPREMYADKDGFLCQRPVPEITNVFKKVILDLAKKPKPAEISPLLRSWLPNGGATPSWEYHGNQLVNLQSLREERCHLTFDVPKNFMMKAQVKVDPNTVLTVGFREQKGDKNSGYKLVINTRTNEIEINGPNDAYPRPVKLDPHKPITIQAFLVGSILEVFVNDKHGFTFRNYDYPDGRLSFEAVGGKAWIQNLKIYECPKYKAPKK